MLRPTAVPDTSLRDVVLAVQTEIPLVKQHLSDQLWALRGEGTQARRFNRLTRESTPLRLRPSGAVSIEHGYASIARFFPGARDELAAIDEAIVRARSARRWPERRSASRISTPRPAGSSTSSPPAIDRFVADLRPLLRPVLAARGLPPPLTCHPYDVCTALIAEENGVIVTDAHGQPLDVPLNVDADVAWAGYANASIRAQVEPLLQQALRERGWIERPT